MASQQNHAALGSFRRPALLEAILPLGRRMSRQRLGGRRRALIPGFFSGLPGLPCASPQAVGQKRGGAGWSGAALPVRSYRRLLDKNLEPAILLEGDIVRRTEERSGGKEGVVTFRTRWSPAKY